MSLFLKNGSVEISKMIIDNYLFAENGCSLVIVFEKNRLIFIKNVRVLVIF